MAFGWDTPATVVPYVESLAAHVRVGRDALVDEVARQHPGPSGDLPLVGSPRRLGVDNKRRYTRLLCHLSPRHFEANKPPTERSSSTSPSVPGGLRKI